MHSFDDDLDSSANPAIQASLKSLLEENLSQAEILHRLISAESVVQPFSGPPPMRVLPPSPLDFGAVPQGGSSQLALGPRTLNPAQDVQLTAVALRAARGVAGAAIQIENEYQVTDKAGRLIRAGVSTAKELDEKYNVSFFFLCLIRKIKENAVVAAKATYAKAKELNDEHKIVEGVVGAAKGAAAKAAELEREHHLTSKAVTIAKATVTAVQRADEQYKITETAGKLILKGFNAVAAAADRSLQPRPSMPA